MISIFVHPAEGSQKPEVIQHAPVMTNMNANAPWQMIARERKARNGNA